MTKSPRPIKGRLFFGRYARWIVICFALATPLIVYSAFQTVRSNSNKVEDWLPATFAETHDLAWFREFFVADQFVLISWDGCRLGGDPADPSSEPDDPRIERLANMLVPPEQDAVGPPKAEAGEPAPRYFGTVMTGRRVLQQLTSPPMSVPYGAAVERLQGTLIGPDGRQTCLVVTLTDETLRNLRQVIGRGNPRAWRADRGPGILFQALEACGIPADSAHLGGPPVDNVAIDEEGERTLIRLAGLSGLLGLGLAWVSLRSVKLTLIVFATGMWSALSGLAAVWLTGETSDAVLMSMPALVYVLAVSGAIHIINYYRDAVQEHGPVGAPERALGHAWKPALLCSLTTAIGLLSLYASDLEPIRKFGVYSAIGVFSMLGVLLLFLPAALQVWPPALAPLRAVRRTSAERFDGAPELLSRVDRLWRGVGGFIIRRHAVVAIGSVLFVVTVGWGITRTQTSIDLLKLFDSKARVLADYRWLEQRLGRLIPMEVVLRFPSQTQQSEAAGGVDAVTELSFLDRMEIVAAVQQSIEQRLGPDGRDLVGRTMSAVTFAPELPSQSGATLNFVRRSAISQRLAASRPEFERSGYFRIDSQNGSELWRISLRVAAFEDIDFGRFVEELRQAVDPVLAAHHYRNDVLRKVAERRDEASLSGATVLLWEPERSAAGPSSGPATEGLSVAERLAAAEGLVAAERLPAAEAPASTVAPAARELAGEGEIAGEALRDFLRRDRLRLVRSAQDPAELPLTKIARLRQFDAVVLAGEFRPVDVERIRLAAGSAVVAGSATSQAVSEGSEQVAAEAGIAATYTGVVPIVYKTQRVLLSSLIESAWWSFLTITPLMMFVCRSAPAGAVAMLPNVLPVLLVFGGMGWLGFPIDIGSMMAASIALGVAVDDTIHYLTWFREGLDAGEDRPQAILTAYRRCATPTLQAALINGLGLSVFIFSTFTPTRQFGFLMLTILVAGVIAELVMLPALLAGPLGRTFRPTVPAGNLVRRCWRNLTAQAA